jgi:hypothetical protein
MLQRLGNDQVVNQGRMCRIRYRIGGIFRRSLLAIGNCRRTATSREENADERSEQQLTGHGSTPSGLYGPDKGGNETGRPATWKCDTVSNRRRAVRESFQIPKKSRIVIARVNQ